MVIKRGEEILSGEIKKEKKVEILKILAFASVAQGAKDRAKEYFLSLLSLSPKFFLDPINTSPKIMDVFQAARGEFAQYPPIRHSPLVYFYPGLFQIKNKNKGKGYILFSLKTGSALGFIATSILVPICRQNYLDKRLPEEIAKAYNQYKLAYIGRQVFGLGIGLSYGLHLLDLKLSE